MNNYQFVEQTSEIEVEEDNFVSFLQINDENEEHNQQEEFYFTKNKPNSEQNISTNDQFFKQLSLAFYSTAKNHSEYSPYNEFQKNKGQSKNMSFEHMDSTRRKQMSGRNDPRFIKKQNSQQHCFSQENLQNPQKRQSFHNYIISKNKLIHPQNQQHQQQQLNDSQKINIGNTPKMQTSLSKNSLICNEQLTQSQHIPKQKQQTQNTQFKNNIRISKKKFFDLQQSNSHNQNLQQQQQQQQQEKSQNTLRLKQSTNISIKQNHNNNQQNQLSSPKQLKKLQETFHYLPNNLTSPTSKNKDLQSYVDQKFLKIQSQKMPKNLQTEPSNVKEQQQQQQQDQQISLSQSYFNIQKQHLYNSISPQKMLKNTYLQQSTTPKKNTQKLWFKNPKNINQVRNQPQPQGKPQNQPQGQPQPRDQPQGLNHSQQSAKQQNFYGSNQSHASIFSNSSTAASNSKLSARIAPSPLNKSNFNLKTMQLVQQGSQIQSQQQSVMKDSNNNSNGIRKPSQHRTNVQSSLNNNFNSSSVKNTNNNSSNNMNSSMVRQKVVSNINNTKLVKRNKSKNTKLGMNKSNVNY